TAEDYSIVPRSNIISDPHGLFQSDPDWNALTRRYAGFDKLFLTLLNGVVDDPDYALRKDPRVYERMLRDPQIFYCLEVRKAATTTLEWQFVPPEGMETDPQALEVAEKTQRRWKQIPRFRK